MKILAYILLILPTSLYSQISRVTLDYNTSLNSSFGSISYTTKNKKNNLLKIGVSYGNFGKYEIFQTDYGRANNVGFTESPYSNWTNNSDYPFAYIEDGYTLSNVGLGFYFGLGHRWKITQKITSEIFFNLGYIYTKDSHVHYYEDQFGNLPTYISSFSTPHSTFYNGLQFDLIHKIYRKIYLNIGGQVRYMVPLKTKLYQPNEPKLPMFGVEYNIQIGISYKLK